MPRVANNYLMICEHSRRYLKEFFGRYNQFFLFLFLFFFSGFRMYYMESAEMTGSGGDLHGILQVIFVSSPAQQ